jgi:acyl-CoA dehydrogenase
MDFNDNEEQARFRSEVKEWLAANAGPKREGLMAGNQENRYQQAVDWYHKRYDAGYSCLTWPKEYGGQGLTQLHQVIWNQEVSNYGEPDEYFVIGIGNCGPALMAYASEEMKKELLPRMARADDIWCQLFSEPGAGSDVAGLSTKATKDGDGWKLNGQKIWTSGAQYSRYGVILTRTDPTVSKYRGLTMFMIDLQQPGVEVKPIKQIDGGAHFNEVFFNDAVVPDSYRLGGVNEGWGAALTVLMNERLANASAAPDGFEDFFNWAKSAELDGNPASEDPVVRDKLATWYSQHAGVKATTFRMITAVSKGGVPGAEGSLGKLVGASMNQDIANFVIDQLDSAGQLTDDESTPYGGHFQSAVLMAAGIRLAGGTDEIMRNIIAEQVLGLPQEPRADKGVPFNEIPSGNTA